MERVEFNMEINVLKKEENKLIGCSLNENKEITSINKYFG